MKDDIEMEDLVLGHLRNKESIKLRDYLLRGRAYARHDIGALKERWVTLIREMFSFDRANRQEMDDVEAEICFRNDEIPYDVVKTELDAFGKKVAAEMERIREEEPARFWEAAEGIAEEVEDFREQLKKPSS